MILHHLYESESLRIQALVAADWRDGECCGVSCLWIQFRDALGELERTKHVPGSCSDRLVSNAFQSECDAMDWGKQIEMTRRYPTTDGNKRGAA